MSQSRTECRRANPPLLLLALGIVALIGLGAHAAKAQARLSDLAGGVEIGRGEPPVWQAAHVGDVVGAGDVVRTGRGSRAEVTLGTGTVRLYENTLLRLPADAMRPEGPAAVELERGGSLFDVLKRRPADPFEVRTPEVVASVKGTRFGVMLEGTSAAVSVYTGLVGVRQPGANLASEVLVREGFSALGGGGRPFDLSLHPGTDVWNGWSKGVAPPAPRGASAAPGPATASGEVDAARAAALRATGPEVLGQVLENHGGSAANSGGHQLDVAPAEIAADAASNVSEPPVPLPVDPAATPGASDPERVLEEKTAEAILNGGAASNPALATGSGVPGAAAYAVQIVTAGPAKNVVILSPAGQPVATLTQSQLNQVALTGNTSLLGPQLLGVLSSTGADPLKFVNQLSKALK